ncbi:MAG: hypothetical protein ACRDD0_02430, partial [Bacteroidales bacterium]
PMIIDVEEATPTRSVKAKGKRLSGLNIENIQEIDPIRFLEEEKEETPDEEDEQGIDIENTNDEDEQVDKNQLIDDIIGQHRLF